MSETNEKSRDERNFAVAPWDDGRTEYERWCERQKVPIERGFYIEDLLAVTTGPWEAIGAQGAIVDLDGTAETNGAYIIKLQAGEGTNFLQHLFELVVYVVEGQGLTEVSVGENVTPCRWSSGSVFAVPLNSRYRHIATEDCTLYCVHTAPMVMNLFHNDKFVTDNPFNFEDRFSGGEGFFSEEGQLWQRLGKRAGGVIYETNFVRDVASFKLHEVPDRGKNNRGILFQLGENTLIAHISEFPPGMYKKAHRHGPGAHVIIIDGEGYSVLWNHSIEDRQVVPWRRHSVLVPPNFWWHQHFNVGNDPARYLAIRWGPLKHRLDHAYDKSSTNQRDGGNQIDYDQQEPIIDNLFRAECEKRGVTVHMPTGDRSR